MWPVRLDPIFPRHPKMLKVGPLGRELFVAALCHCNLGLTDGWLKMDELRALTQYDGIFVHDPLTLVDARPVVDDLIESLIVVGAFEYHDGRVLIHDYPQFQSTRDKVLAQREAWREQKRARRRGLSLEKNVSAPDSERKGLGLEDSRAREAVICPVCGPMPFASPRRLHEHLENLHPELAEAARAS